MSNGRPWAREEIDQLCRIVDAGGDTLALSVAMSRTHEALMAKARRLQLDVSGLTGEPLSTVATVSAANL